MNEELEFFKSNFTKQEIEDSIGSIVNGEIVKIDESNKFNDIKLISDSDSRNLITITRFPEIILQGTSGSTSIAERRLKLSKPSGEKLELTDDSISFLDKVTLKPISFVDETGETIYALQISSQGAESVLRGISTPVEDSDAANKKFVEDSIAEKIESIDFDDVTIKGLTIKNGESVGKDKAVYINPSYIAIEDILDEKEASVYLAAYGIRLNRGDAYTIIAIDGESGRVSFGPPCLVGGIKTPVKDDDAATKEYVDNTVKDAGGLSKEDADKLYLNLINGGTIEAKTGEVIKLLAYDRSIPAIELNDNKRYQSIFTAQAIGFYDNDPNSSFASYVDILANLISMANGATGTGFLLQPFESPDIVPDEDIFVISGYTGGPLRAKIIDPADPLEDNEIITKKYVDNETAKLRAEIEKLKTALSGNGITIE